MNASVPKCPTQVATNASYGTRALNCTANSSKFHKIYGKFRKFHGHFAGCLQKSHSLETANSKENTKEKEGIRHLHGCTTHGW